MASSNKPKEDWIELYQDIQVKNANMPRGHGWKTFMELKEELNIGQVKLRGVIKDLQEEGKVEVYEGSYPDITGQLKRKVWYRIKPGHVK